MKQESPGFSHGECQGGRTIMTIEQQYDSVKEAVQKQKFKQLVMGEEFKWENLQHIPANVPSDISSILRYGLYRLYPESKYDIPNLLISTIRELLQGSPAEIWTAYSIVWYQYRNELINVCPFKIISQELLNAIRASIDKNKEAIAECNEFVGENYKDGLLGDIIASNNSLRKNFGVSIL